jgi:hypothetical protein
MKLERFLSFNESTNQDVYKLDRDSADSLSSDDTVSFVFIGSREYTLKVMGEKQAFELIPADAESIKMTFGEFPNRKEDIVSFEPTKEEGELLYKWIARILSVVEWSNTSDVSRWHTFESDSDEPQPLGSTGYVGKPLIYYTFNAPNGIFGLEILSDLSTFKLVGPGMEDAVIGTLDDVMSNSEYYKSLSPDNAVYNWIQYCFGRTLIKYRNLDESEPSVTRSERLVVNHKTYGLQYDPETDQGIIYLPARLITFKLDELYEKLPELPALESGEVDRKIRKRLEYYNISMPPAPYEIGFVLKNKRT